MNAVANTRSTRPFVWLLQREYWENRGGFFWAPLITGAIIVGLNLILAVIGSIAARRSMGSSGFVFDHADTHEVGQALGAMGDGMLVGGVIVACIVPASWRLASLNSFVRRATRCSSLALPRRSCQPAYQATNAMNARAPSA